jgi:hypothetical protein
MHHVVSSSPEESTALAFKVEYLNYHIMQKYINLWFAKLSYCILQ